MASQRCLVADCGFCVATSALAPLASRRGKNWKSECRPDMIRMIENHNFLMLFFLTLEEQNRVTAQAKRKFSLLSHTPANRNECPCCKHFLTTPANTSILSLSIKNQNFKYVTLTRAPSQPVALLFDVVCCLLLFVVVCCCLLLFVVVCCCLLLFVVVVFVVCCLLFVVCCLLLLLLMMMMMLVV